MKSKVVLQCCISIMVLICFSSSTAFARILSDSETYRIDYFSSDPELCFELLRKIALSDGYNDWEVDAYSREIIHDEDLGESRRKEASNDKLRCNSNGTVSITASVVREDVYEYHLASPQELIAIHRGHIVKEICEKLTHQANKALNQNKIRQLESINEQIELLPSYKTWFEEREVCKPIRSRFSFTVNTTPVNTRIRILNIKPKYYAGIKLRPGKHTIEVSKPGYKTSRINLIMSPEDGYIDVTLERIGPAVLTVTTTPAYDKVGVFDKESEKLISTYPFGKEIMLKPGEYVIVVAKEGYNYLTGEVTMKGYAKDLSGKLVPTNE